MYIHTNLYTNIHTFLDTKYEREYVFNSDPCMIYVYIYIYGWKRLVASVYV